MVNARQPIVSLLVVVLGRKVSFQVCVKIRSKTQ